MPTRDEEQSSLTPPASHDSPTALRFFGATLRRSLGWLSFFRSESSFTMEKRQLIEEIRKLNPSATQKFLRDFDEQALRQYLSHLTAARAHQPRPIAPERDRMVA